jgi:hypothetical protein
VSAAPGDAGVRLILPRMAPMSVRLAGAGADVAVRFDALDEQGVEIDESYASRKQDDDADWIVDLPLLARQVRLHVDGYVDVVLAVHPVLGKTTDLGTVTLDRGAGVAGRVIACDGLALGNATVSIVGADGETGLADVSLGPDGVFEVHGLAQGSVQVRVASDGYVAVSVSAEARVEPTPLKITLRHGCLLRVRVLDADKLAALCDQIDALAADGAPATDGFSSVKAGTYEQRVPAGRWRIVATRGDLRAEETVDTADGATREVTLRLGR